ncbi:MAG TPA: deoxyribonuclease IV [Coriobacteriia bacterium]|nr:deoxyribonuclease IV [Coriobacteriia bacterium]
MLIGAHVSVAGGYVNGLDYGESIAAECIQIFAKSPRQWRGPKIDPAAGAHFVAERERRSFGPAFSHTAYLINLSTTDDELRAKSVVALADEIVRGAYLGVAGVVTHIGNDPGGDSAAAAQRAAASIRQAFEFAGPDAKGTRLLLENTAGAGRSFGCCFTELADVFGHAEMPPEQLGWCFDTCHGFAYGMPVDSEAGWEEVISEIETTVTVERLGLVHGNDCMFERGSKRDRHAWIGDGHIGVDGFRAMLCRPELKSAPLALEMPGETPEKDIVNIERLKALRLECSPSQ